VAEYCSAVHRINGSLVDLVALEDALRRYWLTIANEYRHVEGIKVVVIDLTLRKAPAKQD